MANKNNAARQVPSVKIYEKWLESLFVAMGVLAAIAGVMIVGLIGASVTMRYLAYTPFRFTEELVGLLMTAAFFLALPLITLRAKHVRVLMLLTYLPERTKRPVNIMAGLFGLAFCLWFFALCLPWFEFAFDREIKTEVGRLLMYPWMALLPISMLLSGLAFVLRGLSVDDRTS
ncbi:TRAP transporter small permease [Alphaproteobacteria bacterium LSUCC0719]